MDEKKSPLKAIREKCLECCWDSANEVKLCPVKDCPLYPFRFGKNPYTKRNLTEEQRDKLRERMKKIRRKEDEHENEND